MVRTGQRRKQLQDDNFVPCLNVLLQVAVLAAALRAHQSAEGADRNVNIHSSQNLWIDIFRLEKKLQRYISVLLS